jgi:hypothetical protein
MSVTGKLYGSIIEKIWGNDIDWDNDTIKVGLVTSGYTPDQDTHDEWADASASEVVGTGYTTGGATLGGKTATTSAYTGATNIFALDATDATWTVSTITARSAVVYDDTVSGDPLICYQQSSLDVSTTAGTFTVQWHADGVIKITVA